MSIVKNDLVLVLTGDSKGKISRVLSVNKKAKKVTVEGVNTAFKHVRRSRRNPQGGRLSMEMGIQISNVQLVCPGCGKPTRVGIKFDDNRAKSRVCKKCGAVISQISPENK